MHQVWCGNWNRNDPPQHRVEMGFVHIKREYSANGPPVKTDATSGITILYDVVNSCGNDDYDYDYDDD